MRLACAVLVFLSFTSTSHTQCVSDAQRHYSRRQLRVILKTAQTSDQWVALSKFYCNEARHFGEMAEEQKRQFDSAICHPFIGKEYPSAVDRSRQLGDYYQARSNEALRKSRECDSEAKAAALEDYGEHVRHP